MLRHQLDHRIHALDRRTRTPGQRADQTLIRLLHLSALLKRKLRPRLFMHNFLIGRLVNESDALDRRLGDILDQLRDCS